MTRAQAVCQTPPIDDGSYVVALARRIGLAGVNLRPQARFASSATMVDETVALARKIGLYGFAKLTDDKPPMPDSAVALARKVGLSEAVSCSSDPRSSS